MSDRKGFESLKKGFTEYMDTASKIPGIGPDIDDLMDLFRMVDAWVHHRYTEVPKSTIVGALAVLIYLLSPVDLVPDFIPVLGQLDDIVIVTLVLSLGLRRDIEKFRKWRNASDMEVPDDIV